MEIQELRIGNCVSVNEKYTDSDLLVLDQKNFESLILFKTWHRIHPIPLTEEWLVRLGFEKFGDYYFRHPETLLMFHCVGEICIFEYNKNPLSTPIEYVHQLQNLYFALTGTELEVKTLAGK